MKGVIFLLLLCNAVRAQQLAPLTVEKIMRDPKWMGVSPSSPFWSADSKTLYFNWNPESNAGDSLYGITLSDKTPKKVSPANRRELPSVFGIYNRDRTKRVFEKNGDIFLQSIPDGSILQITNTLEKESNASFSSDEKKIFFTWDMNLFSWNILSGAMKQLTDFRKGSRKDSKMNDQERWLRADQLSHFEVLKHRNALKKLTEQRMKRDQPPRPKEIYIEEKNADNFQVSPDENYITYRLVKNPSGKNTLLTQYVTESGFTEEISSRPKVGTPSGGSEFFIYDIREDTTFQVLVNDVPGIDAPPDYKKDYPSAISKKEARPVNFYGPIWSEDGKNNLLAIRSLDNKDRWLMKLDLETRKLTPLDHQRDEAWIGGPGVGGYFGNLHMGWLKDNKTIWFQTEESGYSHLYLMDVIAGKKRALTSGKYEVQFVHLSRDKKVFYLITNEVHPGEKQFYKLSVEGGKEERLTTLSGANDVLLSPDEKWLCIRYSYSNKPWELYLQENKPGSRPIQITDSPSVEFKSYPWRDPEIVPIKARDGAPIFTRIYKSAIPNGAAIIFVHGAGYLQNAHKWWSSYFREYMFHNLLADKGYTVIDMDYRASSGYGRDWRTGIYRFMGGKDLTDQIDGAQWLVSNYKIDPKRIGIYGGSYGGFVTLMAMFTTPDVFAAGAALRPVTDWAHYNHGYTASILNEPFTDSLAYAKSSPIYYAGGLKGSLLICHGMVDSNVHFQDVVRLSQRLIELGKDNWELAVYPVEDHGFVEPSSWTDEYKRILKLFETKLK
jgi:dipeptidyl aminopeptidase/acylaminoacyl peptidase